MSRSGPMLLLLFAGVNAAAAEQCLPVDAARSEIRFAVQQAEQQVRGSFTAFDGEVCIAAGEVTRVRLRVDAASAATGVAEADVALRSSAFLAAETYPWIVYESDSVSALDDTFHAGGTLEIRGRRQPQATGFHLSRDGAVLRLDGELTLARLAFGVGTGAWADTTALADLVRVSYRIATLPEGIAVSRGNSRTAAAARSSSRAAAR